MTSEQAVAAPVTSLRALADSRGKSLPPTDWLEIRQERINLFADATEDHQWIHVDPVRARGVPYGVTIAHGFLTLSMIAFFLNQVVDPQDVGAKVNDGLERVRFTHVVPVGARVRGHFIVNDVRNRGGLVEARLGVSIEIEGEERPAVVAELIILFTPADVTL